LSSEHKNPADTLEHLSSLANSCEKTFRPYLLRILEQFISKDTFHILPPSQLKPYDPTTLPHSVILRLDDDSLKDKGTGKTKAERERTGRAKWHLLNTWVDERASTSIAGLTNSVPRTEEYDKSRADVLRVVSGDVEKAAERNVLDRLKSLATGNAEIGTPSEGVERLEKMAEKGAGILRNQWNVTDP
jgi:hypothetical protein